MRDLYEVLEVERTSTFEVIKKSYRKLAKKYHPDLNPDNEDASEKLKEINLAYEVLSDSNKRKQYDLYGDQIFQNGNGSGQGFGDYSDLFGDLFSDFFSGGFKSNARRQYQGPRKGADVRKDVELEFEEAVFGKEIEITYHVMENCKTCHGEGMKPGTEKKTCEQCNGTGQVSYAQQSPFGRFVRTGVCDACNGSGQIIEEPCEDCKGSGQVKNRKKLKVKITAGVDNGSVIQIRNEGHAGVRGGEPGDLFIVISVREHDFFVRNGLHLFMEMPISFTQAALGDEIDVPLLEGYEKFKIAAGTQTGTQFRLKGKGVTSTSKTVTGDLFFTVNIITPKNLTDHQKELLREFAGTEGKELKEHKKNLFDKVKDLLD